MIGPNYLMVPRGFPDSSVGKESACNAGDQGGKLTRIYVSMMRWPGSTLKSLSPQGQTMTTCLSVEKIPMSKQGGEKKKNKGDSTFYLHQIPELYLCDFPTPGCYLISHCPGICVSSVAYSFLLSLWEHVGTLSPTLPLPSTHSPLPPVPELTALVCPRKSAHFP